MHYSLKRLVNRMYSTHLASSSCKAVTPPTTQSSLNVDAAASVLLFESAATDLRSLNPVTAPCYAFHNLESAHGEHGERKG